MDIEVTSGRTRPLVVPSTIVDVTLLTGESHLVGWSLRDASSELASQISGSVVAPGAGATIAVSGAQGAGQYTITWSVELIGTAAAADANNFGLFNGATLITASQNAGAAGVYPQEPVTVTLPLFGTYAIKAIGAGTAGVTYNGEASSVPAGQFVTLVEIRDAGQSVAEIALEPNGSRSQGYGAQGIYMRGAIVVHVIQGSVVGNVFANFDRADDIGWNWDQ